MEKQRRRILLIIPEMIVGGAQRSLSKISLELSAHHHVSVVIFNRDLPVAYPCGGEIHSLDVAGGGGVVTKMRALLLRIKKLKALKRRLNTEVSISFLEGADYINVLSKNTDKIILSVRGSKLHDETMKNKFHGWRTNILIPWLYRKADHIVVVNQGIEDEIRTHFKITVPVTVVHNFYSSSEIARLADSPLDSSLEVVYQSPVLITTGRLAVEKGLDFLLLILASVKKDTRAKLVIVGDGPEYGRLVLMCQDLHLSVGSDSGKNETADVIFAGNQENVYAFLKRASVYLLASSSEGFPNSLVEAMCCGVPVIAADCPYGPREILTDGHGIKTLSEPEFAPYGILMPMPSADNKILNTWAVMIGKALGDSRLREHYAAAGRKRAEAFSAGSAIGKWLGIIDTLAGS